MDYYDPAVKQAQIAQNGAAHPHARTLEWQNNPNHPLYSGGGYGPGGGGGGRGVILRICRGLTRGGRSLPREGEDGGYQGREVVVLLVVLVVVLVVVPGQEEEEGRMRMVGMALVGTGVEGFRVEEVEEERRVVVTMEATQAVGSRLGVITEALARPQTQGCRRCLEATTLTQRVSMARLVRAVIAKARLVITGAGVRVIPRGRPGGRGTVVGSRHTWISMMWRS